MIQNAVWIPPSLCGCQLRIVADFTDGSVVDGISYRHPKPFTITELDIISVCDAHQPQTLVMPDISGLMETDQYTGQSFQQRGYLKHPVAGTTAECLYQFLSQYGGQTQGFPCGCKAHQFVDENKNITYLDHPLHSKSCFKHKGDTLDMQQATSDFMALVKTE